MQTSFNANRNSSFTHCASTTINTTSSIPTQPSSTSNPTPKHSSPSGGTIAGIAIAAVVGLAFVGFLVLFFLRRHRASADRIHHPDSNMGEMDRHIDPFYTQPSDGTAVCLLQRTGIYANAGKPQQPACQMPLHLVHYPP